MVSKQATAFEGGTLASEPDDERTRLRKAGFTEDRIDALLRPEAPPPPSQAAASFGGQQAPMSGALGNLNAAVTYAKGVIPAVEREVKTAADARASASRRTRAFIALALIVAVVAVIGYAVSLELSILQNQSRQTAAQAEQTAAQAKQLTEGPNNLIGLPLRRNTENLPTAEERAAEARGVQKAEAEATLEYRCTHGEQKSCSEYEAMTGNKAGSRHPLAHPD